MSALAPDPYADGWRTRASPEALAARARFPRDELLARIGSDLRALFPGRVERAVLYGSRRAETIRNTAVYGRDDLDAAPAQETLGWAEKFVAEVERVLA